MISFHTDDFAAHSGPSEYILRQGAAIGNSKEYSHKAAERKVAVKTKYINVSLLLAGDFGAAFIFKAVWDIS